MTPDFKQAVGVLLCLLAPLPAAAQDAAELKRLTIEELMKLERRVTAHDHELRKILNALRQLLHLPSKSRRRIGFGE